MTPIEHLLELGGSEIQPGYVPGSTLYVGRPEYVRAHARIRLTAGSPVGQVALKWQGTKDPSDPDGWQDLVSRRDDSSVTELEHTFAVPAGSISASFSFLVDVRGFLAVRLLGRSTGGVGQVGDEISVDGVTW